MYFRRSTISHFGLCSAIATFLVSLPLASRSADAADVNEAVRQKANTDLDAMAQELAKLVATPGFRGYIRSEIAGSKNREGILELDPFLERAARRRDAPQGLGQFREMNQNARKRILSSTPGSTFKGYDLYIPVDAHRAKWRGGDDFVVAFAPIGDDQAVKRITAYSVGTGQKVMLDASEAPDTVVLMLAPCEHDGVHETTGPKPRVTPEDRVLPKADATGEEVPEQPVQQSEGNSYVGLRRMYIRDVKEPWWLGAPEIELYFAQRKGTYCEESFVSNHSVALELLDHSKTWRTTWSAPKIYRCDDALGQTCFDFDSKHYNKMYVRIYESDFLEPLGTYQKPYVFDLYPGVSCVFSLIHSDDDLINGGTVWRNNFNYGYDYNHDMGNAYVKWHKVQ